MALLRNLLIRSYGNRFIFDGGKRDISSSKFYMPEYQSFMDKVDSGHYTYSTEPCPICGGDFLMLSDSERYFLPCGLGICQTCGLVQLAYRMSALNYQEFYQSGEYQKLCMDGLDDITHFYYEYKLMAQYFLDFFRALKMPIHKLAIYEIGCGSGGILLRLSEHGIAVAGSDIDANRVEVGRSRYGLDLSVRAAEELNEDELKGHNVILLSNILEHVHQPQNFLSHLHKVLPPDALLVVDVPHVSNAACYTNGKGFAPFTNLSHIWYFSVQSLNNLMHRVGFQMQSACIRGAAFTSIWQPSDPKKDIISDFSDTLWRIRMADAAAFRVLFRIGAKSQSLAGRIANIPYHIIGQSPKTTWVSSSDGREGKAVRVSQ